MNKIGQALSSRTFWTLVVIVILNTIHANSGLIPTGWMDTLNPVLGLLGTYFHVNPSQYYSS